MSKEDSVHETRQQTVAFDSLDLLLGACVTKALLAYLMVFFKWANPGIFFIYFHLFKHTLQFLQIINVKKISIQYTVMRFKLTTFGT